MNEIVRRSVISTCFSSGVFSFDETMLRRVVPRRARSSLPFDANDRDKWSKGCGLRDERETPRDWRQRQKGAKKVGGDETRGRVRGSIYNKARVISAG